VEIALLHMDRLIALKGEEVAVKEMRKNAAWYLKGLPNAAQTRDVVNQQTTREGMRQALLAYVDHVDMATAV
jgi:tRNA-dihydrouridine synthase